MVPLWDGPWLGSGPPAIGVSLWHGPTRIVAEAAGPITARVGIR